MSMTKVDEFESELKALIKKYLGMGLSIDDVELEVWRVNDALLMVKDMGVVSSGGVKRRRAKKFRFGARRWSKEEDKALLTELGVGWGVKKMARVHKRSVKSVYFRLKQLGHGVAAAKRARNGGGVV